MLSPAGKMIQEYWLKTKTKYPSVNLHEFVIMPNHIHGIIDLDVMTSGGHMGTAPTVTIGGIIQWFKTMTTNEYIHGVKSQNWKPYPKKLWQRNYYEHIIRNLESQIKIESYITQNPSTWQQDKYFQIIT